jgi:UrcA family protein
MFKTQVFGRTLMIAALTAGSLAAGAQAVHAEDMTVRVGDLSRPDAVKAFNQRLERAADIFCAGVPRADLARSGACRDAVRQEALSQLSPDQLAQVETPRRAMAQADSEQASLGMAAGAH